MHQSEKTIEEVKNFLKKNNSAVIATSVQGVPHASTVHYIIDEEWNFYFLTKRNTKKYSNISLHPEAALVVGTGPKHIGVQARGIIKECDQETAEKIMHEFQWVKGSHLIENWPVDEMAKFQNKESVMIKFEPLELTFMNLDDSDYPVSLGRDFHKII